MKIAPVTNLTEAMLAYPFIASLDQYYPDIGYWFVNQVVPGVVAGYDTMLLAKDGQHVAGLALGKRSLTETKLRCIRVHPDHQQQGLGLRLIDRMLDHLEERQPIVTVAEELFHLYSRPFVKRYGFALADVQRGVYRPRKLEYYFNGTHT